MARTRAMVAKLALLFLVLPSFYCCNALDMVENQEAEVDPKMNDKRLIISTSLGHRLKYNGVLEVRPEDDESTTVYIPKIFVNGVHRYGKKKNLCFEMEEEKRFSCLCHPSDIEKLPSVKLFDVIKNQTLEIMPKDYLGKPYL